MKVEKIPVDKLIPYVNNSRTHSETQISQIAASIREFGFNSPILLDKENTIIAGHGRVAGAKKLGMDKVPCIRLEHLSEAQKKAYIIADNKLAENADWDLNLLGVELEALKELDFDVELLGFDNSELDKFLNGSPELQNNSGELDQDNFNEFDHSCPKCGFEFND